MNDAPAGKTWEAISVKERRKGAGIALGLLVAACVLIWWSLYANGQLAESWWYVWPFPVGLLPIAAIYWFRKRRLVLTPQAAAGEATKKAESERKQREIEDKWWFRYPMAALTVIGAWYLVERKPGLWWLSLILVLAAAVHARELSLVVIGLALLGAVLGGLAALPLPLAVVIAGALIAYAVYRGKDPSIDTRLPVIGKFILRRREQKEAAALLSNPFIATLDASVRFYWVESVIQKEVNAELREDIRTKLVAEGALIANSENPVMELRRRLADAVGETARLQVLVMPPSPEEDRTGIRGQYGVSGELKAHLLELATKSTDLREWLHGFGPMNTWDDVWNPVLMRYWIVLSRANILAALREPLDDAHPVNSMDWFKPFLATQCGYHEHAYRDALGMPSNLASDPIDASLEAVKLTIFTNCVLQGARYPDLEWKDRMANVGRDCDANVEDDDK